jgi:hypothetical protein
MLTIDEIRKNSPAPQLSGDPGRGCCVGGYIHIALGGCYSFPGPVPLGKSLMMLNPALNDDQAYRFALRIIMYNDDFHFETAWEAAKEAEQWRPASILDQGHVADPSAAV